MMPLPKSLRNFLPPFLLVCSLSIVYLSTLAPTLTWANSGSDGGDLIAAAATGGVAHPTGYPLYLLLARLFQFLPLGSLAFRTNLLSAVAAVSASVLIYKIVTRSRLPSSPEPAWLSGLVAAYAFGLAPLVWSQAVITEVYTLHAFLTTLLLYLYAGPDPLSNAGQKRLDCWRGFVLGLAMSNHILTLLLLPAALVSGSIRNQPESDGTAESWRTRLRKVRFEAASLGRQSVFLGLGMSLYLLIPLRAMAGPPVNWGNAVTPARIWWQPMHLD